MSDPKRQQRPLRSARPVEMTPGFHRLSEGSVLYKAGGTIVLCTASVDDSVPPFLEGKGKGWITAEYQMHPRSNPKRRERRDGREKPLGGRTREIQRLIGRALRAAIDLEKLGERSVTIDCDVLEADGGTRTASITGGWVALALALDSLTKKGVLEQKALRCQVAAISAGEVDGDLRLDLEYSEDSTANVDLNVIGTNTGDLVEIQGTAEGVPVPRKTMDALVDLGVEGIASLCEIQKKALEGAGVDVASLLVDA